MPVASTIAAASPTGSKSSKAPQHLQALARANRVRLARAALKRAVGAGDRDVAEIVLECPWEAESMTISELLSSQRRWGRTRSRKLLQHLAMSENKQVGALVQRQRIMLASALQCKGGDTPPSPATAAIPPRPLIAA
jgi:hypothetical protein